ncbi:MAG: DUF2500 domain-containing protein [Provencibacterium sp.]|nr:DUF2500 domain-containing protein [Provencibacterium sp.]
MFFASFSFSPFFALVPLLVGGVFLLVFILIILQLVRGAARWQKNNRSPVLTVQALVVAKRNEIHHFHSAADSSRLHASSRYYATFELENGERMELPLSGEEYGLLAQGDRGRLTFQGTRYLGFERHRG